MIFCAGIYIIANALLSKKFIFLFSFSNIVLLSIITGFATLVTQSLFSSNRGDIASYSNFCSSVGLIFFSILILIANLNNINSCLCLFAASQIIKLLGSSIKGFDYLFQPSWRKSYDSIYLVFKKGFFACISFLSEWQFNQGIPFILASLGEFKAAGTSSLVLLLLKKPVNVMTRYIVNKTRGKLSLYPSKAPNVNYFKIAFYIFGFILIISSLAFFFIIDYSVAVILLFTEVFLIAPSVFCRVNGPYWAHLRILYVDAVLQLLFCILLTGMLFYSRESETTATILILIYYLNFIRYLSSLLVLKKFIVLA